MLLRALALFASIVSNEVPEDSTHPPAPPTSLEATAYGIVYEIPAMASVRVTKDVTYTKSGGRDLKIDIALPKTASGPLPAVVFLNAIGDRLPDRLKEWAIYRSWPKLIAASGLAGVSMDCDAEHIQESLAAVFDFLEKNGKTYGIDGTRIGIYAASANVRESARLLFGEKAPKSVKAAVFYYGVPDAPDLRDDLPVLVVTAESDLGRVRDGIQTLFLRVMADALPWTFEMGAGLPHAFDSVADNDASRRTIQRTIAFWKSHLEPMPASASGPSEEREILAAMFGNDDARLKTLLDAWIPKHENEAIGYAMRGTALAHARRGREARSDLERALQLGSTDPGVHGSLGIELLFEGRHAESIEHLRNAIAGGWFNGEVYAHLGHALLLTGDYDEGVKAYERAMELGIPPGAQSLGNASYNLACGYARLDRKADALAAIEKAVDQAFGDRHTYETDTDLESIRKEPRFQAAIAKLSR